jgi:hypothetical protein
MRVLVTGNSKYWKVGASTERALRRAGHETLLLDDRKIKRRVGFAMTQRWARRLADRFRPDFVILDKCTALDHETVYAIIRDRPNAMWYHDPQWVSSTHLPDIARVLSIMHMAKDSYVTGFVQEWRQHRAGTRFLPAAGDMELHPVPPDPAFASEVAFIGTGTASERVAFLSEIARHAQLKTWGQGWEPWKAQVGATGIRVERDDFARVCSSSAITLGVHPKEAQGATDYASNRIWLTILAGGFYLGPWGKGLDRMLHDGVHCAWYTDVDDCVAKIRDYLARPADRDRIRQQGEAFVRQNHTFDQRIQNLLGGYEFVNPLA